MFGIRTFVPLPQDECYNAGWPPYVIEGEIEWSIWRPLCERPVHVTRIEEVQAVFAKKQFEISAFIIVTAPEEFQRRYPSVPYKIVVRAPGATEPMLRTFFAECNGSPRALSKDEYRDVVRELSPSYDIRKRDRESLSAPFVDGTTALPEHLVENAPTGGSFVESKQTTHHSDPTMLPGGVGEEKNR